MTTELAVPERRAAALDKKLTPMDLLQLAIEKEGSIDVIERLAKLQLEIQDRDDKVAFANAMAKFKDQDLPRIIKTRSIKDKDGNERYKGVALEDVADALIKSLLKHGITYRWVTDAMPNGNVEVTCFMRLEGTAYEEQGSTLAAPPDTSGNKDALKAVGSTTSYLEKYTLIASCGVHVSGHDPEATEHVGVTNEVGNEWICKIQEGSTPEDTMKFWTQAINVAKNFDPIDYKAMTIFTDARDEHLKKLRRAK